MHDEIWNRSLDDFHHPASQEQLIALLQLYQAHSRIRVSVELAFSRCLPEAWAVLRGAVESAALATVLLREPALAKTWAGKTLDPKAFRKVFSPAKDRVFLAKYGLDHLLKYWSYLSEGGSHATFRATSTRLDVNFSGNSRAISFNYLEAKKELVTEALMDIIICCSELEKVLFRELKSRLKLDSRLITIRNQFHKTVGQLISDYKNNRDFRGLTQTSLGLRS